MDHIRDFLKHLQLEKHYSPNTIISYETDLTQFSAFAEAQFRTVSISEVDHHMIKAWLLDLMEHQTGTRSVSRKISTLKAFYKYLRREGILTKNPLLKIQIPKISKDLPVYVKEEEMRKLFDPKQDLTEFKDLLSFTVLDIFYSTGMRLSELINLKVSDIDFHRMSLKVLGKRNKERIIPFSSELGGKIRTYIDERGKLDLCHDYLLVTDSGKKLYPKFVYNLVKTALSSITTINKKSPHVLRHTFATHMLNNGADLNAIKELLGHSSLAATQVYTHNSIDRLKDIHRNSHPKA